MTETQPTLGRTERLVLRHSEEADLKRIGDLWTDPSVTEHIGGPRDRNRVIASFREYAADPWAYARDEGERWWSIVEQATGQFAGLCALIEKEVEGCVETELDYFLLPTCWGRGYAVEAARLVADHAFTDLGSGSLVAVIDPRNEPSAQVAQRLGMVLEREVLRSDGVVRRVYRLTHSRWEHLKA